MLYLRCYKYHFRCVWSHTNMFLCNWGRAAPEAATVSPLPQTPAQHTPVCASVCGFLRVDRLQLLLFSFHIGSCRTWWENAVMLLFAARGQRCSVADTAQETQSGLTATPVQPPPPSVGTLQHVMSSVQRSSDWTESQQHRHQTVTLCGTDCRDCVLLILKHTAAVDGGTSCGWFWPLGGSGCDPAVTGELCKLIQYLYSSCVYTGSRILWYLVLLFHHRSEVNVKLVPFICCLHSNTDVLFIPHTKHHL